MAVVHLRVPYADTSAAMLGHALGLPAQDSLGDLVVPDPVGVGSALSLRLLGASHQVLLDAPGGRVSETVACLDDPPPDALPARLECSLPVGRYAFTADVRRLAPDALRREVDALRRELAGRPHALIGVFPGAPDAVTALLAEPSPEAGTVAWRTWHVYPQTAEIAHTRSSVRIGGTR
jgi:hypothetical protein